MIRIMIMAVAPLDNAPIAVPSSPAVAAFICGDSITTRRDIGRAIGAVLESAILRVSIDKHNH